MLPAYLDYWGLTEPPFALAPNPRMFYLSDQHRECLMRLKFAIHSGKGGALLISEHAGNGKTTTLNLLVQELQEASGGNLRVAYIDYPIMTPTQMMGEIARQLGVTDIQGDRMADLHALRAQLARNHERGVHSLVIVDEGQMLADRPDLLQEFRVLLNLCTSGEFLLSFILAGQAPLEPAVRAMPEFWQRLPVRFFLKDLHYRDTSALINYRLRKAGAQRDIFTDTAMEGIYRHSKGCPRVICSVADLALVVGHGNRARHVDFVEVTQACGDMEHSGGSYHYFNFLEGGELSGPKPAPEPPAVAPFSPVGMPVPTITFTPSEKSNVPLRREPMQPTPKPAQKIEKPVAESPTLWTHVPGGVHGPITPPVPEAPVPEPRMPDPNVLEPHGPESRMPAPRMPAPNVPAPNVPETGLPAEAAGKAGDDEAVTCGTCGTHASGATEACDRCGAQLKLACKRCKSMQSVLRKACAYCGFPLSAWAAGAEQEFLAGLKRLNLYRDPHESTNIKYRFHRTLEGRVLYFAGGSMLFRQGAKVRELRNGHATRLKRCGLIIGSRRLVFLMGERVVDIALNEITACELVPENDRREGGLIIRYRDADYEVRFPVREGRRTAFHHLVHSYLTRMREVGV